MILVQRLKYQLGTEQVMLEKYFTILAILSSLHLAPAQIRLLAFTARKGGISSGGAKSEFCEMTGYPKASLGNLIHQLTTSEPFVWLVKQDERIIVNPDIGIGPCTEMALKIHLDASKRPDN